MGRPLPRDSPGDERREGGLFRGGRTSRAPTPGEHDSDQEEARQQGGDGDDGQLEWHIILVRQSRVGCSEAAPRPERQVCGPGERWRKRTNPTVLPHSWTGRTTSVFWASSARVAAPVAGSADPSAGYLRHRPWLAALLSLVIPGMGQAYAGRPMLGLLMALPIRPAGGGHLGVATADRRLSEPAVRERVPRGVLVLDGSCCSGAGSRSPTPVHAMGGIQGHDRRVAVIVVGALLVVTVAMHGGSGLVVARFDTTLGQVFGTEQPTITRPGGEGGVGGDPEEPVNEPAFESDGTERINPPARNRCGPRQRTCSPTSCSSSAWIRSRRPR